jgi:hypothetical protein
MILLRVEFDWPESKKGRICQSAASILSLSDPSIPANAPSIFQTPPIQRGNVWLPWRGGKLDDFFYNPLQAIEFRIYDAVGRFIYTLSQLEKTFQLTERIWPAQQRSGAS